MAQHTDATGRIVRDDLPRLEELPIGTMLEIPWDESVGMPAHFEEAAGQAVSRSDPAYSRFFAVYGTLFGAGDGSSTFNLPKA